LNGIMDTCLHACITAGIDFFKGFKTGICPNPLPAGRAVGVRFIPPRGFNNEPNYYNSLDSNLLSINL
jgi:hypothetical protein